MITIVRLEHGFLSFKIGSNLVQFHIASPESTECAVHAHTTLGKANEFAKVVSCNTYTREDCFHGG